MIALMEKTRIVTLSNRAPVEIHENAWPLVACSYEERENGYGGSTAWRLSVREHEDGRLLVYGRLSTYGQSDNPLNQRAGYLIDCKEDLVRTIRLVGAELNGSTSFVRDCIADLPAEKI